MIFDGNKFPSTFDLPSYRSSGHDLSEVIIAKSCSNFFPFINWLIKIHSCLIVIRTASCTLKSYEKIPMEFKRFLKSSGKADVALRAALAARQNSHPYKPSEAANSAPNLPRQPLAVAVGVGNQDRNSPKESQPQPQEPQSGISLPGGICKPDGTPVKTKYRLRRMVKGRIEVFEFDVMMPAGNQRYVRKNSTLFEPIVAEFELLEFEYNAG